MLVEHLLVSAPAARVRTHELRLDGAGADERDLDDEIVQSLGTRVQDGRNLRPALDLERADRLAAGDEVVRCRVVGGEAVHRWPVTGAPLDLVERVADE